MVAVTTYAWRAQVPPDGGHPCATVRKGAVVARVERFGDAHLLQALQSGDAEGAKTALERAYRGHARALLDFVTYCMGDACRADQVVEDVFVHLWNEPASFQASQGSLRACLAQEAYRRSQAPVVGNEVVVQPDGYGRPSLWRRMNSEERVAIGLAHFGQMTTHEVADVLGVSPESVKATIAQGLHRLAGAS